MSFSDEVNPFFEATSDDEVANTAVDPHSLFGDSDDSDWEGLDGGKFDRLTYLHIVDHSGFRALITEDIYGKCPKILKTLFHPFLA